MNLVVPPLLASGRSGHVLLYPWAGLAGTVAISTGAWWAQSRSFARRTGGDVFTVRRGRATVVVACAASAPELDLVDTMPPDMEGRLLAVERAQPRSLLPPRVLLAIVAAIGLAFVLLS